MFFIFLYLSLSSSCKCIWSFCLFNTIQRGHLKTGHISKQPFFLCDLTCCRHLYLIFLSPIFLYIYLSLSLSYSYIWPLSPTVDLSLFPTVDLSLSPLYFSLSQSSSLAEEVALLSFPPALLPAGKNIDVNHQILLNCSKKYGILLLPWFLYIFLHYINIGSK